MTRFDDRSVLLQQAWLGDAVLALYVREKILREDGVLDGDKYTRMTSNQFLSAWGEPSAVEAVSRHFLPSFVRTRCPPASWTIFAPALMTFLLLRVSGAALLERTLLSEKPEYAAYVREVPAFWPRRLFLRQHGHAGQHLPFEELE